MARDIAGEWSALAEELAAWTLLRLVLRMDRWGAYWVEKITLPDGSTVTRTVPTTAPREAMRGRLYLGTDILERHYRATRTEDVVGLHGTSIDNRSLWIAVDIDFHGESSSPAEINAAAAQAWFDRLVRLGFRPLLTGSNGRGGFHLRVVFSRAILTAHAYAFVRWLIADHARHGLPKPPECFPKQRHVEPGKFGSWLRLPGRHHSRDFWSRVWDGAQWLEGAAAAEFILSITGDDPAKIPAESFRHDLARPVTVAARVSGRPATPDVLARRIRAFIDKMPTGLGEGMHRDDHAFNLASFLARDLALPDAECLSWLAEWDGRQHVSKGAERLQEILANARRYGKRPIGCGLAYRTQDGHIVLTARAEF